MEKHLLSYKKKLNTIAEIGWQERQTTTFIQKTLKDKPVQLGFGGDTGLLYQVGTGTNAILLRADIDALKTQSGVKHTCGHSSHTAALMGAYLALKKQPKKLPAEKAIYFLFQPAEETYPSGAKAFLEESAALLPQIHYAFAAHVRPKLPLGIAAIPNVVVGRGDYMEIEIQGKMVHVKNTPDGIDALEAASQLILFIKGLQRRFIKTLRINIGVMHGGLQPNAVADYALLKGDIRMKDNRYQEIVQRLLQRKIAALEKSLGVRIAFRYFDGYPPLKNDAYLQKEFSSYLNSSTLRVTTDDSLFTFGSEDFSFIAAKVPSLYTLIGTGDKFDIHQPECTISDKGTEAIYKYFTEVITWWIRSK